MTRSIDQMVEEVRAALDKQLAVRGRSLEAQVRKAGRRLPRRVRADATYLAGAVALAKNPKLVKMIDLAKAKRAHRHVLAYLATVDLAGERRTAALNLIGSIAFAILGTGILLILVLWLRGFI